MLRDHLSVKAIKGKFEQLQDSSNENYPNAGESHQFRRQNNAPFTKDFQKESFPAEYSESGLTSSRLRSLSVGNHPPSYHDKTNNSSKKISRNQSLKQQRQNENDRIGYANDANYPNNFTSFSEKQRLVESIVQNIKNSAKKKEEKKPKDFKVKDVLSITSKLEKDLKNVIERGTRLKWGSKFANRSSLSIDKNTELENFSSQQYGSISKPLDNDLVNVDLYPIRACISEDIDISDERNNNEPFRSESSPDLSKQKTPTKLNYKHMTSSVDNRTRTSSNKKENSLGILQSLISDVEIPDHNISGVTPGETSPVRPPRRRVKKNRAPPPPKMFDICSDQSFLLNPKKKILSGSGDKRFSDKSHNSNLDIDNNCDLNNGFFNYEENYERTLEEEQLFEKEANEHLFATNSARFASDNDCPLNLKHQIASDTSHTDEPCLSPASSPPKKPPRTFAHDIYRTTKNEDQNESVSYKTPKLTSADIESLYTKPLKRLIKDKPISSSAPPLPKLNDSLMKKPVIAPKPTDILSKAKKRFSVAEPMTTKNQIEKKSSIKRNSSFRFSFKKSKSVGSPLRQTTPRKETNIGKKIRMVTRNWSPRRDPDKRVRFQSDCNSDDNLDDCGPIYATPQTHKQRVKESPKELHYMCSPLFKENARSHESHKENRPPPNRAGFERFGLMDGLRQELRQSCRLVQKRLKSASNDL